MGRIQVGGMTVFDDIANGWATFTVDATSGGIGFGGEIFNAPTGTELELLKWTPPNQAAELITKQP